MFPVAFLCGIGVLDFTSSSMQLCGKHGQCMPMPQQYLWISLCPSFSCHKSISQLSQAKEYVPGALGVKLGALKTAVHSHTSVFEQCCI